MVKQTHDQTFKNTKFTSKSTDLVDAFDLSGALRTSRRLGYG